MIAKNWTELDEKEEATELTESSKVGPEYPRRIWQQVRTFEHHMKEHETAFYIANWLSYHRHLSAALPVIVTDR